MELLNLNMYLSELNVFLLGCYAQSQVNICKKKEQEIDIDHLVEMGFQVYLKSPMLEVHTDKTILKGWAEYFKWCDLEGNTVKINSLDKLYNYNESVLNNYPKLVEQFVEVAFEIDGKSKTKKLSKWF